MVLQYSHKRAATFIVSPKLGELAFGVAAFANDDRSGMHPGAEFRHKLELRSIGALEAGDLALNRLKAAQASDRRAPDHR
jgi:hypothetical protein